MGIFSRMSDIVNANLNAMLDKAEHPEKMVKLMICEMEDTLTELKATAASVVADRVRHERELSACVARTKDWSAKAELAMQKSREDLAREALEQKLALEQRRVQLESRLAELTAISSQYQDDLARLEEKLRTAKARQRVMIANHKSLLTRRQVEEQIYKVNTSGAFARFDNYESKMDRLHGENEILAQSNRTLEERFVDLEVSGRVDDELAELRERVAQGAV